jgi:hypothetical protein
VQHFNKTIQSLKYPAFVFYVSIKTSLPSSGSIPLLFAFLVLFFILALLFAVKQNSLLEFNGQAGPALYYQKTIQGSDWSEKQFLWLALYQLPFTAW